MLESLLIRIFILTELVSTDKIAVKQQVTEIKTNSEGIPLFPELDLMDINTRDLVLVIGQYLTELYREFCFPAINHSI